jgi:uncharacterized protein
LLTLPITPGELAIALALAVVGSAIQGAVGFGLAVIAAPILLLINPIFVPGPMLLAAMILTILMAHRERASVVRREVAIATVGRILGMLPAAYAMTIFDEDVYSVIFAVLILLGVALSVSGWHLRPTPGNLLAASTLSGFTGTISSVGGPPLALVYQHEKGPRIRATMSAIFTVGTVVSVIGLWQADKFGLDHLLVGLAMAPGIFVGFYLSRYVTGYVDRTSLRPAILVVVVLSSVAIVVRVLTASPGQ